MTSFRVAVVDDEPEARSVLLAYLARYEEEHDYTFDVHVFEDGAAIIESFRPIYDIILLDIRMPGVDGMSTAETIREIDDRVTLIFVTNLAQYAVRGYRVDAMSYLLKPLTYFSLSSELTRAINSLAARKTDSIVVGSGTDIRRIAIPSIVYVESKKHRNIVHMFSESFSYTGALRDLDQQLSGDGFFRINSYYLANLRHIVGVSGYDAKMSNGAVLKVARSRRKDFMEALTEYLGGPIH